MASQGQNVYIHIYREWFYRMIVDVFVLSKAGLLGSISVHVSILKRRIICRNYRIIECICYSIGSLL